MDGFTAVSMTFALIMFLSFCVAVHFIDDSRKKRRLDEAQRVKHPDPQIANPSPGICQCNHAFAFHATRCEILNCRCQRYTPSTLSADQLIALDAAFVAAITGAPAQPAIEARAKPSCVITVTGHHGDFCETHHTYHDRDQDNE